MHLPSTQANVVVNNLVLSTDVTRVLETHSKYSVLQLVPIENLLSNQRDDLLKEKLRSQLALTTELHS